MIYLFKTMMTAEDDATIRCELIHPDMHYGILCSMLERVQLRVNKTYIQLIKGPAGQYQEKILLQGLNRPDRLIALDKVPKYAMDTIQTSDESYRIGPDRRLSFRILPLATVELSFFIASGIVPSGMGRPAEVGHDEDK